MTRKEILRCRQTINPKIFQGIETNIYLLLHLLLCLWLFLPFFSNTQGNDVDLSSFQYKLRTFSLQKKSAKSRPYVWFMVSSHSNFNSSNLENVSCKRSKYWTTKRKFSAPDYPQFQIYIIFLDLVKKMMNLWFEIRLPPLGLDLLI